MAIFLKRLIRPLGKLVQTQKTDCKNPFSLGATRVPNLAKSAFWQNGQKIGPIFWIHLGTFLAVSQNPLMGGFWSLGIQFYRVSQKMYYLNKIITKIECTKMKKITIVHFFLLGYVLHPCVICLLLQSNMWTYDIWRRDLTVFDRGLHLKEILSKMCSFWCCLLLPIIAGEVRALRAEKILSKMAEHGAAHGRRQIRSFRAKPRRLYRLALPPASEHLLSRSIPFKFQQYFSCWPLCWEINTNVDKSPFVFRWQRQCNETSW